VSALGALVDEAYAAFFDEAVGADERAAAWRCLTDTAGCAVAGADDPAADAAASTLTTHEGVRLLGRRDRARPADAMLVQSASIRALDFNDVYSGRNNHHPSENVVPAVLAVAELDGWDGARALDAVARSYRVALGLGELWAGLLDRGWAPSGTIGRISTAVTIAALRGLDPAVATQAAAIATVTAPTLGVVFKGRVSGVKSLVNGMAGRAAWEAVDLALAGLTGPSDALEAPGGFDTMVGGERLHALPRLGCPDISLKAYPTVFMTHAAIAAALELRARAEYAEGAPSEVVVSVPEAVATMAAAPRRWSPASVEEAQFSLPVAVAVALSHGSCRVEDFAEGLLEEAGVQDLLSVMRVEAGSDPSWSAYGGGRVSVVDARGRRHEALCTIAPGHPDRPLTDQQVKDKTVGLASRRLGDARAEALFAALAGIADAESLTAVFDAAAPEATP
jgi:2-methylcitrate dehydratase PrpD